MRCSLLASRETRIYCLDMNQETTDSDRRCAICGEKTVDFELQTCSICRSLFCRKCAVDDYGRSFCSKLCRGFFFHGDGDEVKEDF